MQSYQINSAIAAALSSLVYIATVKGILFGVLLLVVPVIPLLWVGLRNGAVALSVASLGATIMVLALAGLSAGIQFGIMLALPTWVFTRQLLKVRLLPEGGIEWFPVGGAFVAYSFFCFLMVASMALYLLSAPEGGMLKLLQEDVAQSAKEMDAQVASVMQQVVQKYAYIILPAFCWGWGLLLYGCAWIAKEIGVMQAAALRKSVALTPFLPPLWWFAPLGLSGLAALSTDMELRFAGLTCFLILLLPYFMVGVSMIDRDIKRWAHAGMWRFGFYFLLLVGQWSVAMMVTLYGVFLHVAHFYRAKPLGDGKKGE